MYGRFVLACKPRLNPRHLPISCLRRCIVARQVHFGALLINLQPANANGTNRLVLSSFSLLLTLAPKSLPLHTVRFCRSSDWARQFRRNRCQDTSAWATPLDGAVRRTRPPRAVPPRQPPNVKNQQLSNVKNQSSSVVIGHAYWAIDRPIQKDRA